MFKNLLVLALFLSVEEAAYLLPNSVTNFTGQIAEGLVKKAGVDRALFEFGNALSTLVNVTTGHRYSKPIYIGRDAASSYASPNNILEQIETYITEIRANNKNEDANMKAADILAKYGYPVEKHKVTTEDSYILTMFRIPRNGTPVLLLHGIFSSSDDFILAGPGNGLAYLLADKGYDVWMGNARGNKHSRRHATLKPAEAKFWDFSWHEIGVYDLPAMINYILFKTNENNLKFIGHSQGNTAFFVMASEKPEYNEKVSLVVTLSPIAYIAYPRSPVIRLLAPESTTIYEIFKSLGIYEFLPDSKLSRTLKTAACGWGPLLLTFCYSLLFLATGFDFGQTNVENLPVVFGHVPSGSSVKQVIHYAQGILSKGFRKFDYGATENRKRYGVSVPPSYKLDRVTTPVCIMYAEADWLAHPKDVQHLRRKLKNVPEMYKVPNEKFNHMDFLFAKDVKTLVNDRALSILSQY